MKNLYFVWILMLCQNFYGQTDSTRIQTPDDSRIIQPAKSARPISMVISSKTVNNAPELTVKSKNLSPNNIINSYFHDTVGEIEVNGGGQLQFNLPIALPPGIKSVAPQINLNYTSGSGNGIAGYGWNMSGITTISRIGKNIEKDGEIKGVQLDYYDYYSFNGQRLILKSGEYGKNGAEYFTEKFSNIKIKSVGSDQSLQGPEYWEITFEDGSQAWYGATASGGTHARTPVEYNIVKWKDSQGNYITYNYLLANNVATISSIQWGGNEDIGKSHFNEIIYNYNPRKFKEISYLQGLEFVQSLILNKITVKSNHKIFKEYVIDYNIGDTAATYEVPSSITEKNSKGEEANPVSFYNTKAHYNIVEQSINNINTPDPLFGDFNGDGYLDNLSYSPGYAESEVCIREDINGYCEEYVTFPGMVGGTYITFNKLDNNSEALKVSDVDLSKGIVTNFLDDNNKVPGRSTITLKQSTDNGMSFKTYVLREQLMTLVSEKNVPKAAYDHTNDYTPPPRNYEPYSEISTTFLKYKELDVNGDGISEILFSTNDYECKWDIYNDEGPQKKSVTSTKGGEEYGRPPLGWGVKCYNYKYTYLYDVLNGNTYPIVHKAENDLLNDAIFLDMDGDGISDLVENKNNRITYQTFKKNANDKYGLTWGGSQSFIGESKGLLFGDFNGDGKTDFMVPYKGEQVFDWRLYVNTGKSFNEQVINNFSEYRPDVYSVNSGYKEQIVINHLSKDVNGDGKDDVVRIESRTYKKHHVGSNRDSELRLKILVAAGGGYNNQQSFKTAYETITKSTWEQHYFPINISYRLRNIDQFLIINHGPAYSAFSFYNILQNFNINQIQQGGILTDVSFIEMDGADNELQNYYEASNDLSYPYGILKQLPNKFLVKSLHQGQRKQEFRYKDLVFHLKGRGMIGFRQFAKSSWYTDNLKNTKIWSGVQIDPLNNGVTTKEWSVKPISETLSQIFPSDLTESNDQLLSSKITEYRFDKLLNGTRINMPNVSAPDLPKIVSATLPIKSITNDFKKSISSENTVIYDHEDLSPVLEYYYLPTKTINSINTDFAVSTTSFEYSHNKSGSGKDYYVGRLISKDEKMNVYVDTKGSKEEYIYKDNLLETLITYNRDNTGGYQEKYVYNGWGNVVEKRISTFSSSQMQNRSSGVTEKFQYDVNGRFVTKKTNNIGLETNIAYNDWGQVTEQTDPMGEVLNNEYDHWGKLVNSKTNLSGTTNYQYIKENSGDVVTIEYAPDGTERITYINSLRQKYLYKNRKFGQGEYVSTMIVYDGLGRKISNSEPFSGASPSKWNIIEYDEYSRPLKVVSFTGKIVESTYDGRMVTITETNANNRFKKQTSDPLGNIISTEDLGGTITFKFNAAGENIEANYEENTVKTSFDAWGNKIRFEDPSNGIYEYEYKGFMGAISRSVSPKGEKTYKYNTLGQLVEQTETSSYDKSTDKSIQFSYNSKGLLTGKSGNSLGKFYSSSITYDTYGRVLSSYENSNNKSFINKGITYDDKMRITSYEKELHSSGVITKVSIENEYDSWSGILFRMKEKGTGKVLWQLNEANEKGQVTKARLGGVNINNNYLDDGFLDYIQHESINSNVSILYVDYSFNAIKNELNSRTTGGDLNIIENFQYDNNNRLYNWTDPVTNGFTQNQQRNIYDNKGRITQNDQVGEISFSNAHKLYQPTQLKLNAEGSKNYTNDLIQTITYNENNDPFRINGVRGDVVFEYGLTSMRQRITYGGNFDENKEGKFTKFYSEDGSYEVVRNNETGEEKHLIYIGGTPYESNIVYVKNYSENNASFKFLHKDYLGSILAITDESGTTLEQRHFDAWGNLTHLKIGSNAVVTDKEQIRRFLSDGNLVVDRGYTSHEHFSEVGLIHMNGRLYDPLLRRFLNADENIQDPNNTQNYNKYGYVLNNPMMYNDPNGEFFILAGLGALFWKAVIIGAAVGLGSYTAGLAITGNLDKWSLGGALKATFFGAVGGAATFGIGSIFSAAGEAGKVILTSFAKSLEGSIGGFGLTVVQAGTHAISQGVLGLVQGGDFISSAVSGFAGSLGASGWTSVMGTSGGGMIAFGALAGGTGSVLTGGNFWEGALIGGIVAGLNHGLHKMGNGDDPPTKRYKHKKTKVSFKVDQVAALFIEEDNKRFFDVDVYKIKGSITLDEGVLSISAVGTTTTTQVNSFFFGTATVTGSSAYGLSTFSISLPLYRSDGYTAIQSGYQEIGSTNYTLPKGTTNVNVSIKAGYIFNIPGKGVGTPFPPTTNYNYHFGNGSTFNQYPLFK